MQHPVIDSAESNFLLYLSLGGYVCVILAIGKEIERAVWISFMFVFGSLSMGHLAIGKEGTRVISNTLTACII